MSRARATTTADVPTAGVPAAAPLPEDVQALLRRLRMPHVRAHGPEVVATAKAQRWEPIEVLRTLLAQEVAGRDRSALATRRATAGFPTGKTFDAWQDEASSIPAPTQQALRTLEWVRRRENLVVCGPSGTGKTFLLEALGQQAVEQGLKVAWFSLENLGVLLRRHRADDSVTKAIARVLRADLVVVDDIGLLPVSSDAAEGLYRLVDAAYEKRSVAVSSNLHPAAFDELMPKTLATDLLTAPVVCARRGWGCSAQATHRRRLASRVRCPVAVAVAPSHEGEGADMDADDGVEDYAPRDMSALVVPAVGVVAILSELPGVGVIDASGEPVSVIGDFLNTLLACGASAGSVRSYALALLRWWRFLAALSVPWERASRVEVRDFVLWMRFTATPAIGSGAIGSGVKPSGYAPATINHNLAVLRSFYADRIDAGLGPLVNPVPQALGRGGQRVGAHHNPMEPSERHRRAPLRQKLPTRLPRSLPDQMFNSLFAVLGSDRDRALVAFYVSTGARASELLGVDLERVDVGAQRIGVHRKGSGRLQWLPASSDAFVWLRIYQQYQQRPQGERALWLTRRAPHRPLTYPAIRRVLQRANDRLGTHWTLHDLRHTAAHRMTADPALSLTDVQWVLGHAHLSTTQLYLRPREDEVVARVLEHHNQQRQPADSQRPASPLAGGYRPEVLRALLGEAGDVH